MKALAYILGLFFAIVAVVYLMVPAGSLPQMMPGFEAGSSHVHLKHAFASAMVAVICLGGGYFIRSA
jgi:hypothetical protein